jgi:hypothetical protein
VDPDPGGPKTCGSGSGTLKRTNGRGGEGGVMGRGCVMPKKSRGGGELGGGVGTVQLGGNLGLAVIPCQLRKMYILFVNRAELQPAGIVAYF